ncbi:MAG: hypothetical protein V2A76_06150, partial [Planctomycetota bacterium]
AQAQDEHVPGLHAQYPPCRITAAWTVMMPTPTRIRAYRFPLRRMSLFASALTQSQIVAFILGVGVCLYFVIIGLEPVASIFPQGMGGMIRSLSLTEHFENIQRGVVDTRDMLYYASMLGVFLMLNTAAVKRR